VNANCLIHLPLPCTRARAFVCLRRPRHHPWHLNSILRRIIVPPMRSHRYLSRCSPLRDARCCAELRQERRERGGTFLANVACGSSAFDATLVLSSVLRTYADIVCQRPISVAKRGGFVVLKRARGEGEGRERITPGKKKVRRERRAFFSLDSLLEGTPPGCLFRTSSPYPPRPQGRIALPIRDVSSRSSLNPRRTAPLDSTINY